MDADSLQYGQCTAHSESFADYKSEWEANDQIQLEFNTWISSEEMTRNTEGTFKFPESSGSEPGSFDDTTRSSGGTGQGGEANGAVHPGPFLSPTAEMAVMGHIAQLERKLEDYKRIVGEIQQREDDVGRYLEDISCRVETGANDPYFDTSAILRELETAEQDLFKYRIEKGTWELEIQRAGAELDFQTRQLATERARFLAANGNDEPQPVESQDEPVAAASWTSYDQAVDDVAEDLEKKQILVQEAEDLMDAWSQYYNQELDGYRERVEAGVHPAARTNFDLAMLQKKQQATRALIDAEHALDATRQQAFTLGVVRYSWDQESGFGTDGDDGYTPSLEEHLAQQVDRARIERWMDGAGTDDRSYFRSGEGDEWECRSVNLDDSISVVASGKERTRIDRWRAMCNRVK